MVVLVEVVNTTLAPLMVGMVYLVKDMMEQTRLGPALGHNIPLEEAVEKVVLKVHMRELVVVDQPQEMQTTIVLPEEVAVAVVDILGVMVAVLVALVVEALVVITRLVVLAMLVQALPILVEVVEDLNLINPLDLVVLG